MMKELLPLVEYQSGRMVELERGADIRLLLKRLTDIYGGRLKDALFDESMNIRKGISIYLNGVPFNAMRGLNAKLKNRDSLVVYPPISGKKDLE
jgi:molybdopterin converting factor small subunit